VSAVDSIAADPVSTELETAPPGVRIPAAALRLADQARNSQGLSFHVLPYVALILGAAEEVAIDPAIIAALMEVEGSGETAVSPAGAMGLMQLMPDKLNVTDDPFDPGTNILRAAQFIRRLVSKYGTDLGAVAAAYFGAIDQHGNVTDDSDGNVTGIEYVEMFAAAYQRWAVAFNQPSRPIAIRPVIRQMQLPPEDEPDEATSRFRGVPERDRWYLQVDKPEPALLPLIL
jgi:soluble lytic murein transglycosylase-like protein